jgi:hypothetical protein
MRTAQHKPPSVQLASPARATALLCKPATRSSELESRAADSGEAPRWDLANVATFGSALEVAPAGGSLEQEADRAAARVMRMRSSQAPGAPRISPASGSSPSGVAPRAPTGETSAGSADSTVREVLRSPGQPLASSARAFFEPRFGRTFGQVRIHADGVAARSADALDASAYTVGQDIVFARGRYAPESHGGRHLLAHELTHSVQQRGEAPLIQRAPADAKPDPGAESDGGVAVWRIENEDGTWSAVDANGEVLDTGPLGPVINPTLPDLYLAYLEEEQREAARAEALRQYADPAWSDPLSPIRSPESYDPQIYDTEVLRRKAAERKFDEYDRKGYGAHGVSYKRAGSGRVYANDIKPEDWKELSERYGIQVSTDPDRVVLPAGRYAYESVYEGKLIKKIMKDNKLPPEAIHKVAEQLEASIEKGAYLSVAGIGTARFGGPTLARTAGRPGPSPLDFKPQTPRMAPGRIGRVYFKVRFAWGLAARGVNRSGANPKIGAGRPTAALVQPASPGGKAPAPTPTVGARPTAVQKPPPPAPAPRASTPQQATPATPAPRAPTPQQAPPASPAPQAPVSPSPQGPVAVVTVPGTSVTVPSTSVKGQTSPSTPTTAPTTQPASPSAPAPTTQPASPSAPAPATVSTNDPQQGVKDALARAQQRLREGEAGLAEYHRQIARARQAAERWKQARDAAPKGSAERAQAAVKHQAALKGLAEQQGRLSHQVSMNAGEEARIRHLQKALDARTYARPSSFRVGKEAEVWALAPKEPDGSVLSPSKTKIRPGDPWVMGHKPKYEFWKHQRSAAERGISREQFLNEYNDAKNLRPETKKDNESHLYEDRTDAYFGY